MIANLSQYAGAAAILLLALVLVLAVWRVPMRVSYAELGTFHLGAWGQSVDPASAFQAITAVPDPVLTTQGNDIRVPKTLPYLVGTAAMINDATLVRAEIQSPSLRSIFNIDIEPIVQGKILVNPQLADIMQGLAIPLVPDESLNAFVQSDPAAPALHYILAWLADGPLQPVKGNIYTIRATSAIALVANTWQNGALVFSQVLPAGNYSVVGMRARGANLVAARLVFVGGTYRPGVPGVSAIGGLDNEYQRFGGMGVFGNFDNTTPPTIDCLGDTDAAQFYEFDLIKNK